MSLLHSSRGIKWYAIRVMNTLSVTMAVIWFGRHSCTPLILVAKTAITSDQILKRTYLKKPLPYKQCLEGGHDEQVRSSYGCCVASLLCYCFEPYTLSPNLLSENSGSLNILVRLEPLQYDSLVSFLVARIRFHCIRYLYQTPIVTFRIFVFEECGSIPLHFVTRKL